jgi:8-amino-7-oxononanoate synthase
MHKPFTINHIPGRTIEHEGREYLFFSGTSYLGIPQHPEMQALLAEGVARYGLHFGSSRNGNLQLGIYEEAEAKLAAVAGAAAALTTSSGMVAGQVVVDWLARHLTPDTVVIQAGGTHPALWHPLLKPQLVPPGWEGLQAALPAGNQLIVYLTDSVNTIRGFQHEFGWVQKLRGRSLWLIVDDSHGLGWLNGGRGTYPDLVRLTEGLPNVRFIVTGSLAKGVGLPGGVILGDAPTLEYLRHTAYFGACSPMPPAYAYAYLRAGKSTPGESTDSARRGTLYTEAHARLTRNVALAEELLLPTGLFEGHGRGFPVFYTEHNDLYEHLLRQGIFIYSFAYPTPAHKTNTRIIISAYHEENDIRALAAAVRQ